MLELKLDMNGKKKVFKQNGVKVRTMREILKFQDTMDKVTKGEKELSALDQIDMMVQLIADMFDDPKVDFDAVIDGIEVNELQPTIENLFKELNGGAPVEDTKK